MPKDLNESVKELNVLKRFRDFKELYLTMSHYHMSLHRKDKFPEFPVRAKYFGRFDDKIIEERKQCSLRLLQFIGSQGHLYRHEKFIEFFTVCGEALSTTLAFSTPGFIEVSFFLGCHF